MTWQQILFIFSASSIAVALLVYTIFSFIFSSKIRTESRMNSIRQMSVESETVPAYVNEEPQPLGKRLIKASGEISRKLRLGQKSRSKKQLMLMRAGILMKAEELTGLTILSVIITAFVFYALSANLLFALIGALIGFMLPSLVIRMKVRSRAKKLNSQLPDALSIIASGIRAGFSFNQAVALVVKDMEAPISDELGKMLRENAMGKPMDEALEALSQRTGDEDLDIVITALLIQRQVGGSLADVLDTIAHTIRERVKLKGDIRTMTAQGKMSATIVSIMPFAMGVLMSTISPGYMDPMFNTLLGRIMLGVSAFMITLGIIVLSRIVKLNV